MASNYAQAGAALTLFDFLFSDVLKAKLTKAQFGFRWFRV